MKNIICSEKFKGLILWYQDYPPIRKINIEKTDKEIQEYLGTKFSQWLEENSGIDEMSNYEDEKEIIQQQHWLNMCDELSRPCSPLIVFEN